ncbi:alpha/beta hydrolase, partial [Clostridioides difficile]
HGGGQTRHAWRTTAEKLAGRGFTAIAIDQRGHGDSAWVDSGAYALEDYGREAAWLGQEIERRFGAKPVAIGASLGGLASL